MKRTCANCQHYGEDFPAYGMDYCSREDSTYHDELVNRDNYCEAWEGLSPKEEDHADGA
jgi:hypothetical protein